MRVCGMFVLRGARYFLVLFFCFWFFLAVLCYLYFCVVTCPHFTSLHFTSLHFMSLHFRNEQIEAVCALERIWRFSHAWSFRVTKGSRRADLGGHMAQL